jgi:hypothetical protein
VSYPTNSELCDYTNDIKINNLETDDSVNYLLHRTGDDVSIITLKNSLTQHGTFTSNNNLLSSNSKFKTIGTRVYTSINSDISRQYDEELSINYAHGNIEYMIKPGENSIMSPDTLYPYVKLNVNDTLFVKSGAFSYYTPKFSDKIYQKDAVTLINGQHLLCTWLSGNGFDSVWVDRYYYPNLISKEMALSGKSTFQSTYENAIEKYIKSNTDIKPSIEKTSFFDKKSDLCFIPSQPYIYKRISIDDIGDIDILDPSNPCDDDLHYFKEINSNGMFQVSFYFNGDSLNWDVFSKRNDIDGGLKISKDGNKIYFNFSLYDPTTNTMSTFTEFAECIEFAKNFIAVSVDALNGIGYFYMNNKVIKMFNFDDAQFVNKFILFGDFKFPEIISNFRVHPSYIFPEDLKTYQIKDNFIKIDNIVISLPSGTRNSVDEIKLLQNICESPAFKSDSVNIKIDGTGLDKQSINELKSGLDEVIFKGSSITMDVEKIEIN